MGYLQKKIAEQRDASTCDNLISSSRRRYDIFLSFRGKDTRKNFTDHLYTALVDSGLRTFKYDDEVKRREDITTKLPRGIQDSHCSIIVLSKDYASSQWCIPERACADPQIQEEIRPFCFTVPVFYDVDPSEVRNQSGSFAKPFEELERLVKPMSRTFDRAFGDFWWRELQGWRTVEKLQISQG